MFCGPLGKFSPTCREMLFIHGGITRGSADSLYSKGELDTTSAGSIENTQETLEKTCKTEKRTRKIICDFGCLNINPVVFLSYWWVCLTYRVMEKTNASN